MKDSIPVIILSSTGIALTSLLALLPGTLFLSLAWMLIPFTVGLTMGVGGLFYDTIKRRRKRLKEKSERTKAGKELEDLLAQYQGMWKDSFGVTINYTIKPPTPVEKSKKQQMMEKF